MLMSGNLDNTCGDDLFLKFSQLLSLDERFKPIFLKIKEKTRSLRFTLNPYIRVGLIVRNCSDETLPLHMIANKIIKKTQMGIS